MKRIKGYFLMMLLVVGMFCVGCSADTKETSIEKQEDVKTENIIETVAEVIEENAESTEQQAEAATVKNMFGGVGWKFSDMGAEYYYEEAYARKVDISFADDEESVLLTEDMVSSGKVYIP